MAQQHTSYVHRVRVLKACPSPPPCVSGNVGAQNPQATHGPHDVVQQQQQYVLDVSSDPAYGGTDVQTIAYDLPDVFQQYGSNSILVVPIAEAHATNGGHGYIILELPPGIAQQQQQNVLSAMPHPYGGMAAQEAVHGSSGIGQPQQLHTQYLNPHTAPNSFDAMPSAQFSPGIAQQQPQNSQNIFQQPAIHDQVAVAPKHICPVCGHQFTKTFSLRRHYWTKHQDNPKVQCPLCQKKLSRPDAVLRHIRAKHSVNHVANIEVQSLTM